jgi:homoserine O-succinyltransferase
MTISTNPRLTLGGGNTTSSNMPYGAHGLTIAVVNNMPDGALRSTERQVCTLIEAASPEVLVRLKFYSPPCVQRSPSVRAHIENYYDDFGELEREAPDGLIVTGAVPKTARLSDDPCFEAIGQLADWAVDTSTPGLWSCLASHAAVLHLDGIDRTKLPQKLSGVYECRFTRRSSQILYNAPAGWSVPHSRYHGLCERELSAHGYAVLSRSPQAGVDLFCRQQGAMQLFFQGHPEYEHDTLLREFRRDVARFLFEDTAQMPAVPRRAVAPEAQASLLQLAEAARQTRNPHLMHAFDTALAAASPVNLWFTTATIIYTNWLSYVASRRRDVFRRSRLGTNISSTQAEARSAQMA